MLYLSIEPRSLSYKLGRIRRKNSAANIIVFFCPHICVSIAVSRLELHFLWQRNHVLETVLSVCWNRGSTVIKVMCYKSEGCWFDPSWCHWNFSSFRSHYGPGVDPASNRNAYREYFLEVKSGWCVRLTTYHHPVSLSRNLRTVTS